LICSSLRQANHRLIDPKQVYRLIVLVKGQRSQSRNCTAGTDKVASRAVSTLEGRNLNAFVVSFNSAMRQLESKSGVSPRFLTMQIEMWTLGGCVYIWGGYANCGNYPSVLKRHADHFEPDRTNDVSIRIAIAIAS